MNCRGMTLLEVLVALVVFSIAAIAIVKTTGEQAIGLGRMEEKSFAYWVADNQLVQLRLEHRWPDYSWTSGESEMAGRTWYWRWRGVETENANARAIDIEVHADADFTSIYSQLRTYVVNL